MDIDFSFLKDYELGVNCDDTVYFSFSFLFLFIFISTLARALFAPCAKTNGFVSATVVSQIIVRNATQLMFVFYIDKEGEKRSNF
jgi:hypothetical protein